MYFFVYLLICDCTEGVDGLFHMELRSYFTTGLRIQQDGKGKAGERGVPGG